MDEEVVKKASQVINTFLAQYFTKVIDEEEINNIMADFPKPKDDDEIKRLIQQARKEPHFQTETALYKLQDQILIW